MSELALKLIAENKARHARGEDASYLDLGKCGLTILPNLSTLTWLETLVVSNRRMDWKRYEWIESKNGGIENQLTELPTQALPHQLKMLVIGGSYESGWKISNWSFLRRMNQLQSLDISYNQIVNANFLKGMDQLQSLDISNNQINSTVFLKGMNHIQSLYLRETPIASTIFLEGMNHIQSLYLGGNKIENWDFLKGMNQLRSLDLVNNRITNADFLEEMNQLRFLNLSSNQIENWDFLKAMNQLRYLYLGNIHFTDVDFLKGMNQLQSLNLSYNQIANADFLKGMNQLQSLELNNNQIANADFLKGMNQLQSLNLNNNQIASTDFLKGMNQLQSLNLSNNQIASTDFLEEMNQLQSLNLSNNQIASTDFLEEMNQLQSLNLSNNKIANADFLKGINQLQSLNLGNNSISNLAPILPLIKKGVEVTLEQFDTYNKINLYNNSFTHPPLEIISQGNAAILRYFEEIQNARPEDIRPLNEAKLIVIGQPRAGKTTLRYKLCDTERSMPPVDLSTRGIDIELQSFQYTDEHGEAQEFKYHIWDFGGQQIYHATHRFFLTKRTVYVAVVDTDVNDKQNDLDYWLHMIELMGDGSPVLLVQNQKNDRSIEVADALRNRFRTILAGSTDYEVNFDRLRREDNPKFDAQRLKDFQHFKKDVERRFEQQAPVLMTREKSDTRGALEIIGRDHPMIELTEYTRICKENGLTDPVAQTDLLRTLHNLGICLWYEGYDFLDRIVILQNRWASDAVFKVLDDETVKKEKGHFRRRELDRIWSADEYCDRAGELVELMKRFQLCYQIGKTDEFIAPQLLDKNPPDDFSRAHIQQSGVRMVIEYEFMPRGIITQFIVAMHRQISGGQRHAWETGFAVQALQGPSAAGMAEESYDSRKLELWAKGPGAGLLLQQMLSELDKIHDSFNRLRYNRLIPCVCERCGSPEATRIKEFDYEEILLEMYQNHQPGIRCSYGNQTVPFENLLGVLGFTDRQMRFDYQKSAQSSGFRGDIAPEFDRNVNFNLHVDHQPKTFINIPNPTNGMPELKEPKHEQSNNSLFGVLIAFAVMFPMIGYAVTQMSAGQAVLTIVGTLLLLMLALVFAGTQSSTLSEDAFVKISEGILKKIPGLSSLVNLIKGN